jgi:hypothetical protein
MKPRFAMAHNQKISETVAAIAQPAEQPEIFVTQLY